MNNRVKIIVSPTMKAFVIKNFFSIFYDLQTNKITLVTERYTKIFPHNDIFRSARSFGFYEFDPTIKESEGMNGFKYTSIKNPALITIFQVSMNNSYSVFNSKSLSLQSKYEHFRLPEKTYFKLYKFFSDIFYRNSIVSLAVEDNTFPFFKSKFKKVNEEWFIEVKNIEDKVVSVNRSKNIITVFGKKYYFHFVPEHQITSMVKNVCFLTYPGGRNHFYNLKLALNI